MSNTATRPATASDLTPAPLLGITIPPLDALPTVALLIGKRSGVVRVFATEAEAIARRDQFNADPFLAEEMPDHDAPYTVQSWAVSR